MLTRKYWGCWCLMSFCMWSVIFPSVTSEIANVNEKLIFLFLLNQLLLLFEDDLQRADILNIIEFIRICCTTVILCWKTKSETFERCSVCACMRASVCVCVCDSNFISIYFCWKYSNSCCDTECRKNFLTPVHETKPAPTHSSRREAWGESVPLPRYTSVCTQCKHVLQEFHLIS